MFDKLHRQLPAFICLLCLAFTGCATQGANQGTLYHALGERPGITALVDTFLNDLADDTRIVHFFAATNIASLRKHLIEQICEISGGPCQYTGRSMRAAHAGLEIKDADFNALVEDLEAAMESLQLPLATQNRLLAELAPMHKDIVNIPQAKPPATQRNARSSD